MDSKVFSNWMCVESEIDWAAAVEALNSAVWFVLLFLPWGCYLGRASSIRRQRFCYWGIEQKVVERDLDFNNNDVQQFFTCSCTKRSVSLRRRCKRKIGSWSSLSSSSSPLSPDHRTNGSVLRSNELNEPNSTNWISATTITKLFEFSANDVKWKLHSSTSKQ